MDLREARKYTLANFRAGNAVKLISPPGMGKTDLSYTLFEDIKGMHAGQRCGMGTVFIATKEAVDANGLPYMGSIKVEGKEYRVTAPTVPEWMISGEGLPAQEYDVFFVVFEEWGQGSAEAKRAFAEPFFKGSSPSWKLPVKNYRLALSNIDKADGVTKEFDFVISRANEMRVTGNNDVWLEDFANKGYAMAGKHWSVMGITKAFAKQRPEVLFEAKPKVQGPWCNPRTLTAWDRFAQECVGADGKIPHDDPYFQECSAGHIGASAYATLGSFLQFQLELPQYEAIVADPDGTEIPNKVDQRMLLCYQLASDCQHADLEKVLRFVKRFPTKDMAITFVKSLLARDHAFLTLNPMQDWIAKNASLVNAIGTLAATR